jgi:hypothetical protein
VAPLTSGQQAFLLTIARRIVPESSSLSPDARARFLALIEDELATRPESMRRQFSLFLSIVRWAPIIRYGRRLDHLDGARQDAVLRFIQHAPIQLVRSGFWGLRTLVYLGYYGRPEVAELVAYRPSRQGNSFLHDR